MSWVFVFVCVFGSFYLWYGNTLRWCSQCDFWSWFPEKVFPFHLVVPIVLIETQHMEPVIPIIFLTNICQVFAVDRSGRSSLRNCKYTILFLQILSCSVTNPRVTTIKTSWILAKLWHNCVYSTALTNRLKTYDYANVCKQCKQSSDNRLPAHVCRAQTEAVSSGLILIDHATRLMTSAVKVVHL